MINNISHYIIAALLVVIAGMGIYISQSKCPEIIEVASTTDTIFMDKEPIFIKSKPTNTVVVKHDSIFITDTVIIKGTPIIKEKIVYIQRFEPREITFTSTDTLRFDSLGVAIKENGNCLGILNRQATLFGKERLVTNTITNTIEQRTPTFSLYSGANAVYQNANIQDVQPNLSIFYKQKFGLEYGYRLQEESHSIGLKFKIK